MQPNAKSAVSKGYGKTWLVVPVIVLFFFIGLYGLWKSSGISNGWKWFVTAFYGLFVTIVIASSSLSENKPSFKPSIKSSPEEIKGIKAGLQEELAGAENGIRDRKAKYLFNTPDDFKDAFNKFALAKNPDLNIDELEIKEGEGAAIFYYQFKDGLRINGSLDKFNGRVTSLMFTGSGDVSVKSGGNIIPGMCGMIAAVDPGIKPKRRLNILKELGLIYNDKVDYAYMRQKEVVKNGIKYTMTLNASLGLWLSEFVLEISSQN